MSIEKSADFYITKAQQPKVVRPVENKQKIITVAEEPAATFSSNPTEAAKPKLHVQNQKVNIFDQLNIADHEEPQSTQDTSTDTHSTTNTSINTTSLKSPELIALDKIAPGWGKRIAMIDPDKDPELNRLTFEQIVKDLEDAGKSGKINEDTGRVIVASLLTKINELKDSDTNNQYGVKEEATQNIKALEMEQEFRRLQFQMMLDFIRDCFTWYDPETGEKHEPESSNAHIQLLSKMHDQNTSQARENNQAIEARNNQKFEKASLLDKNIHLKKLDKTSIADVKAATIKDANRMHLMQQTKDAARLIQQGISPVEHERLIKNLTQEYQKAIPGQNINETRVAEFVQTQITTEKAWQ